ncbi:hypothetical protein [Acidipropionibacterium virtanenii]|nr:hypothetical protein [Acidipropionibacterium virtanenii]
MRRLCALAAMALVISAAGCGNQDADASDTPSPAPSTSSVLVPTPTPAPKVSRTSATATDTTPTAEDTSTPTPAEPETGQTGLPDGFSHQWELHGLSLIIRDNGTAESASRTYDMDGCGGDECLTVMEFAVTTMSDSSVKLTVTRTYRAPWDKTDSEDGGLRPGTTTYPSKDSTVAVGDYYTLTEQADGNALTTLYASSGAEKPTKKFNGLGTPWICTSQTHDPSKCGA